MIRKLLTKLFGSRNDRLVRRMRKRVAAITALEEQMQALSDTDLKAKREEFRKALEDGDTLEKILPEAFATVREAGRRIMGMRHFDEQMIGGMVLNDGKIAEMRTGEGKTLVATLPVYLNALTGKGVHVVTVNDYLARRDAQWMGTLYDFLGMSVGVINSSGGMGPDSASYRFDPQYADGGDGMEHLRNVSRRDAYACDITYGTNNEFGFDYLRDNMAFHKDEQVQRSRHFAVVDEVDSILIDEARTPLIISGPAEDSSELYRRINEIVPELTRQIDGEKADEEPKQPGDFTIEEKNKQVYLTEQGHEKVEELLAGIGMLEENASLYDATNIVILHHVYAGLRARHLFQRDVEYVVRDGQIVIVDEFTGRMMPGRRWSDGLHQAIEAKEGVQIQNENQTLASITFQNFFRLYDKLSGMTGTADTEAFEFQQIYNLEVVVMPTHRPMVRKDMGDLVYLTAQEKFSAIADNVRDCMDRGQPVLVGTASIESSELVGKLLNDAGIKHEVLNAKQHEREAHIVAQAGLPGAVTIATNMAGRGTDIVLGGNLEVELVAAGSPTGSEEQKIRDEWKARQDRVKEAGGLHIIGTERHESRRIDNQLRGRSGRQGDPGSSRFFLSLEDSLMRIFASDRVSSLMQKLGMKEGESIEHPWVSRAIENAQRKVEGHNFDIRKHLLEYDNVANDQRRVIYQQRSELMGQDEISETISAVRFDVVNSVIDAFISPNSVEEMWDIPGAQKALEEEYGMQFPIQKWLDEDDSLHEETLREKIIEELTNRYEDKQARLGADFMRGLEKAVMLQVLDHQWKEHLAAMDYLRQGIGLRSYAQKKPEQEYKREAFEMFGQLLETIKRDTVRVLTTYEPPPEQGLGAFEPPPQDPSAMQFQHEEAKGPTLDPSQARAMPDLNQPTEQPPTDEPFVRGGRKVGRNEPCPCGSGKKYKQCHGKIG